MSKNEQVWLIECCITTKLGVWECTADGRSWICHVCSSQKAAEQYVEEHKNDQCFADDPEPTGLKWNKNHYNITGPYNVKE